MKSYMTLKCNDCNMLYSNIVTHMPDIKVGDKNSICQMCNCYCVIVKIYKKYTIE